jgi:NADPH:quinone reductase-like Zn-dependent oxidoreductase
VTAVCSTRSVELVRSLGAARVIDYTEEDFTQLGERHDSMLDIAGSRSFREFRRVLTPEARVVAAEAHGARVLHGARDRGGRRRKQAVRPPSRGRPQTSGRRSVGR